MTGIAVVSLLALAGCVKQQPVHSLVTSSAAEPQTAVQPAPEQQQGAPFAASEAAQPAAFASFGEDRASDIQ